jgi:hypothetical protein
MTRLEKCERLKELGYTYDMNTGEIFGKRNKLIRRNRDGYIQINMGKEYGYLAGHHFAYWWVYGTVDFEQLDHINRNRSDNRISNLRTVTNQQNQFNKDPKGYYWHKIQKVFRAVIRYNGKLIDLGSFHTKEEAKKAYLQAKSKYHVIEKHSPL